MARYGISAISLNGTLRSGVKGYQFDPNLEIESEGSDGVVFETAHHLIQKRPMVDMQTLALKAMIGVLNGSTDSPLLALNGTTGLVMYGQKAASNAPGFASGNVHLTKTGLRGVLFANGVRWQRGGKAELHMRGMLRSSDGTTASVTDGTAALPTQPVPDYGFTLTALTAGADVITSVNSVDLEMDPKFEFEYSTGLYEPTDVIGAGVTGKIAHTLSADIGDLDLGDGTGACSAVFTQYAAGGALGTATVTFTMNGAWSVEEGWGGENGQRMSRRLKVRSLYDGSTRPLTWATA